jgi:hypothetical protein
LKVSREVCDRKRQKTFANLLREFSRTHLRHPAPCIEKSISPNYTVRGNDNDQHSQKIVRVDTTA